MSRVPAMHDLDRLESVVAAHSPNSDVWLAFVWVLREAGYDIAPTGIVRSAGPIPAGLLVKRLRETRT